MNKLFAGVGRCDITPAPGTPQGGWGAQTHERGSYADIPLYSTALVLADEAESTIILDVDSIGFNEEWTEKIISAVENMTGVHRDRIRFSCTHTHSGPNTFRLETIGQGLEQVLSYLESLPARIAGAAWQAQRNLVPIRFAAGWGSCDINVNRRFRTPEGQMVVGRNWDGAVDRKVSVIRFDDLDERPVATILHYACHPTIMAWENKLFTPDYPGVARKTVEEQVGGMCLFLQGAAGNLGPRRGFTGDKRVYRRFGTLLGLEASRIALNIETIPRREHYCGVLQSGAPIALYDDHADESPTPILHVMNRSVSMPLRRFPSLAGLAQEAKDRARELIEIRKSGARDEVSAATARATQAGWLAQVSQMYIGRSAVDWRLQCIRIGSVALLSTRGEPFVETSQQIAAGSPFPFTLFSGYSNGAFGYIPTREAFQEGGYETENTPLAPGAAELLAAEGIDLLKEMEALSPIVPVV